MNILHICNGFTKGIFYNDLFHYLNLSQINQTVVAPTLIESKIKSKKYEVLYIPRKSNILYRLFFIRKINRICKIVETNINLNNVDLIHAHTLFSDGAVAYNLYKKHKTPYIVAIRNTDINIFFKYLKIYNFLGFRILLNASKIIYISNSYETHLLKNIFTSSLKTNIRNKSIVLKNGINKDWIENTKHKKKISDKIIKLLYIGEIQPNKNIHSIIKSLDILNKDNTQFYLTIIGKGKNDNNTYLKKLKKLKNNNFEIIDLKSKNELLNTIHSYDIFVMPSFTETFGLVYAESLTQGIPIIYSKNQGFDKIFDDGLVGFSVDPNSINDISNKIKLVVEKYTLLTENIKKIDLQMFSWELIANEYHNIYREIVSK